MAKKRRRRRTNYEFKPDVQGKNLLQLLHLTKLQRQKLLKWTLYSAVILMLLILQDVIMSQFHFLGATTDLVISGILLISVMEDSENGGLFALLSATFYVFSGSAPGPYAIGYLTVLAIGAAIFRQLYWRRGFTSNVLCAAIAVVVYEVAVYGTGVFLGLTYWGRIGVFLLTALFGCITLLPLYPLVRVIGKIGGEIWNE